MLNHYLKFYQFLIFPDAKNSNNSHCTKRCIIPNQSKCQRHSALEGKSTKKLLTWFNNQTSVSISGPILNAKAEKLV